MFHFVVIFLWYIKSWSGLDLNVSSLDKVLVPVGAVLTTTLLGARTGISDDSKLRLCLPSIILRPGCQSASGVPCQSAGRLMRSGSQGWETSEISQGQGTSEEGGATVSACQTALATDLQQQSPDTGGPSRVSELIINPPSSSPWWTSSPSSGPYWFSLRVMHEAPLMVLPSGRVSVWMF